jgi:hypothetical protein
MKKLLIVSCHDKRKWYANKIGQFVPLLNYETGHYEYKSRQDDGYINYVHKTDAKIVEVVDEV